APRPASRADQVQHDEHGGGDGRDLEVADLLRAEDLLDGHGVSAHFRVAITLSSSRNDRRTVEPCGHIWTHAGPSGRVWQRSHFVASSSTLPSGRWPVVTISM